jgi:nucleotidyltransferase/DNA polymerase involved in DNA repair
VAATQTRAPRTILHVDLDAFYAAVEVREDPKLRGKPVIVGADPRGGRGRGVVSAASYEARRFGVHSAMPISQAFRLCPHAVFLKPRHELYAEVSARFLAILERFTDLVEPLSIDEAFLDVTGSLRLFGDGEAIARRIQRAVQAEERLSASIGVAPSKFAAKIASDLKKPGGLVVVPPEGVCGFLEPLPVERLFGAGPRTAARLHRLGARTIGDVARLSLQLLRAELGEATALHFHRLANGIDERPVEPEREARSLGRETTFEADVADRAEVARTLLRLVDEVCARLRRHGLAGRTVTVKLRTSDFETAHRAQTLREPADTAEAIAPVARRLLAKADGTKLPIRLVGVAVSHFGAAQPALFEELRARQGRAVESALDEVRRRFGEEAVTRGALLRRPGARRERRGQDPRWTT